jgi:flavin-binding protein dodecin
VIEQQRQLLQCMRLFAAFLVHRGNARSEWTWRAIGLKFRLEGDKSRLSNSSQRRFVMPVAAEMKGHVYKILELVGSSEKGIEDAIQNALTRASKTIRDMKWFEVVQTRGHIEKGSVGHYQVTLRVGFTLEE